METAAKFATGNPEKPQDTLDLVYPFSTPNAHPRRPQPADFETSQPGTKKARPGRAEKTWHGINVTVWPLMVTLQV